MIMRTLAWPMFAMVALSMTLLSSRPAEAQLKCAENWPSDGFNLAGRLDGRDIRAYLAFGYPAQSDTGISGVVFHPSRWVPSQVDETVTFSLDGTLTSDCQIRLNDSNGGVWRLRFVAGQRLDGTRDQAARPSESVSLRIIPATDCSGGGAWRTFASAHWPITFDYPASWRVSEDGDDVVVDCPDAESLALGGSEIWFQLGQGREEVVAADGRLGTSIERLFVSYGSDQWLFGEGCVERPPPDLGVFCQVARQSRWQGMTVLQGSVGEHRRYRPGRGYIGQGPGITSYAFLIGDAWVRIHSHEKNRAVLEVGTPGPVLFDGDGVTARIVRSMKLR